ncbi:MAG: TetR/AcrR family transcriptional regulator [Pseudomonadota bacterium]
MISDRPQRSAVERRAALIDAAREAVLEQGYLPVSMQGVARRAGVSKALVYARFPTQHDLYAAVLDAELDDLAGAGIEAAAAGPDLAAAATAAAEVYREHIARRGPVLHIIYRDPYMRGHLTARALRMRDRLLGHLARRVRRDFGLDARTAIAAVNMALTVPEEAGRLTFQGAVQPEAARLSCRELTLGCLEALAGRA